MESHSFIEDQGNTRNTIAFFLLGFCVYILVSVKIVVAEDVLADSDYPTTVVFTCGMGPWFLTTLILPHFIHQVPYGLRVLFIGVFGTSGLLLISLVNKIEVKLTGVCLTSLSCGVSAVTFIPLTAFYGEATVKAYTGGTGCGMCLGALYYAVLTSWACVLPKTTLLTEVTAPVSLLLIYGFLLDKKRLQRHVTLNTPLLEKDPEPVPVLLCSEKLMAMKGTLRYVAPLYIGVFSQWLVSQSVVTTMAFPNSLFHPRDLYQFYTFAFLLGNFISRSYRLIASLVNLGSNFLIRPTWIVTLTLVAILVFLSTVTWYRSPPSTWMVGGLLLLQGILGGILYTSTFSVVGENKEPRVKEFCRAFTTVASVSGAVTAGFLGLYFERLFVEHCASVERNLESCYTRVVGKFNTTKTCDW